MTIKLDGLTLKELHSLRAKIDVAIQKLESNNISKARKEAAKIAKEYGVSLESLISEVRSKKPVREENKVKVTKKVSPRYRHPDNASLTWTGRGLKPKWIVSLIESGVKLEELLIK